MHSSSFDSGNYFTQIEEHFQRRRKVMTLMTPRDFQLVEIWKEAGIPLEAVLRGIDVVFDRQESGPYKSQKVNSIRYCEQAVLAECERMSQARMH